MSAVQEILDRSAQLSQDYSEHLDGIIDAMVPKTLSNEEFVSRCTALMIALNRELARCAAAFGETHEIEPELMMQLVGAQFVKNYGVCLAAIRGEGQTVQ